jgi:hypothetical protein
LTSGDDIITILFEVPPRRATGRFASSELKTRPPSPGSLRPVGLLHQNSKPDRSCGLPHAVGLRHRNSKPDLKFSTVGRELSGRPAAPPEGMSGRMTLNGVTSKDPLC